MFGSDNLILMTPLFVAMIAVSAILGYFEFRFRKKTIWIVANAVFCTAAFAVLLLLSAALSDVLLFVLSILTIRLVFLMSERERSRRK